MPSFLDQYEMVVDRLDKFWSDHPNGRVWTELKLAGQAPGELVVIWAAVYRDVADDKPWATGIAHQRILGEPPTGKYGKPVESAPEWTSPYEVCETSAVGRALANAGYAARGKRPSREEMEKAGSANELFDVTPWLEQLSDEEKATLRTWWKSDVGPNAYSASAVPGVWLQPITDQIRVLVEARAKPEESEVM